MRLRTTAFLMAVAALVAAGCVRLGDRLVQQPLPAEAPAVEEILDSLTRNELGLKGFKATGTVILQSPELESTQISRESTIVYRQPLDLHVVGRKYGTRFVELTCSGPSFLIQFPTERQFYYRPTGEQFAGVSSADMAREMFRPESWTTLSPRQVRMLSYDPDTRTASLLVLESEKGNRPRRQLLVQGSPWVVLENRLLDPSGREIAVTVKSDYYERDGLRFPKKVESVFPLEEAQMSFTMRKVDLNPVIDKALFDVDKTVKELRKRGFQQVDTLRGGGTDAGIVDQGDGGFVENFMDGEVNPETPQ